MADKESKIKVIFDLDVTGVLEGSGKVKMAYAEQVELMKRVREASASNVHVEKIYKDVVEARTRAYENLSHTMAQLKADKGIEESKAVHIAQLALVTYNNTLKETQSRLTHILDLIEGLNRTPISSRLPSIPKTPSIRLPRSYAYIIA